MKRRPHQSPAERMALFTHSPASWRRATYEPVAQAAALCGAGPPLLTGRTDPRGADSARLSDARSALLAAIDVIDLAMERLGQPVRRAG